MRCESIPTVRRISKTKELCGYVINASGLDVIPGQLAFFRVLQVMFKEFCGPLVQSQDGLALTRALFLFIGLLNDRYWYAALLRDDADGFREATSLNAHYEIKNATAGSTTKAFKESLTGMNCE